MAFVLLFALVALCVAIVLKVGSRGKALPPGPPTVPILGNAHIFPTEFPHYKFTEWARKYGGLFSLKIGNDTVVVLTDAAAVKELLDKRSSTTANRPPSYVGELVTDGLHMVLASFTPAWKTQRRTAAAILTPQATSKHLPIQRAEATQLLHNILHSPQSFFTDIQRYSISVIYSVLHGRRVPRYETEEVNAFITTTHDWSALLEPGAVPPIDAIPILKLIPERWAKWKRECKRVSTLQRARYFGLVEETRERMRRNQHNGSFMEEVLERQVELGMDDEMTGWFGGTLLEGGTDTTSSYIQSLVLALVAYPEAQKKAHEEIDRVVGEHRMPTLEDLEQMPYIRAIISEAHRFRPVAPLAVPHATSATEEYHGYIIPKGTTIFVNMWGILHDPGKFTTRSHGCVQLILCPLALFDNPEDFMPERYLLSENGTKPGVDGSDLKPTFFFGFGRRVCPGMYLAQNSINLNTMNLLWAFDFKPDMDTNGNPIPVDIFAYRKGIATAPLPFKCRITPRTVAKAGIIENEFLETADTFSKFEVGLSPEDKEFVARSREHGR
ncbi:cytochrome P450 [Mycena albidolilacea]|uniref:Cytochrome P450 n=1 Tax=Mycena albidolilacea TaxID=1033008 RepID=A0AAD7F0K8_9AGAR|nr:cytochrome P450 [Mycena albidolilacea]